MKMPKRLIRIGKLLRHGGGKKSSKKLRQKPFHAPAKPCPLGLSGLMSTLNFLALLLSPFHVVSSVLCWCCDRLPNPFISLCDKFESAPYLLFMRASRFTLLVPKALFNRTSKKLFPNWFKTIKEDSYLESLGCVPQQCPQGRYHGSRVIWPELPANEIFVNRDYYPRNLPRRAPPEPWHEWRCDPMAHADLDEPAEISFCGKDGAWYITTVQCKDTVDQTASSISRLLPPLMLGTQWAVFENKGSKVLSLAHDGLFNPYRKPQQYVVLDSESTKETVLTAIHTIELKKSLSTIYGPFPITCIQQSVIDYKADSLIFVTPNGDHVPISVQGLRSSKLLRQFDENCEMETLDPDEDDESDGRLFIPFSTATLLLYAEVCETRPSSSKGRWKSDKTLLGLNHVGINIL